MVDKNKQRICPKCKSKDTIKWGKRKTQNRGKVQRYKCKSCLECFITDPFARMRNTPQKITCALDLFYRGLSTRGVQEHFKAFFPHNSDHSTILRWIRKYSIKIANYTDKLKVQTGSYIEVDEMEFHRRKSHKAKRGIDKNWFIDAIDVKTRFMISSKYAKARNQKELKEVLLKVKNKSANIKIVTTDGLTQYSKVVKRTWGYDNKVGKHNVEHNIVNASAGEGFNIWVERMHNTIRQRTQNFRGFHGSVESAYALMKGIEIFYNFVDKHGSLNGKSPSELAIPSLQFKTANRWLELLEKANKN
jgi:transposase-like protein